MYVLTLSYATPEFVTFAFAVFESLDNEDGQSTNAKKPLHLIAEYKSKEGFGNAFDGCREKLKKRYRNHTKRLDKVFQLVQAHT